MENFGMESYMVIRYATHDEKYISAICCGIIQRNLLLTVGLH